MNRKIAPHHPQCGKPKRGQTMHQKRKRHVGHWIIPAVLLLLVLAILVVVAQNRGWFTPKNSEPVPLASLVVGNVELEREGMATPIEEGFALSPGDQLTTQDGASLAIQWGGSSLLLDSNSQAVITDQNGLGLELTAGQVFVQAAPDDPVTLQFGDQQFALAAAVADLSLGEEHQTLYLLSGALTLGQETYSQGQVLTWTQDHISAVDFEVGVLDDFCINAALNAWDQFSLCYSKDDLEQVRSDREAQRQADSQAQLTEKPTQSETSVSPAPEQDSVSSGQTEQDLQVEEHTQH